MACVNNAEGLGVKLKGFRADHVLSYQSFQKSYVILILPGGRNDTR